MSEGGHLTRSEAIHVTKCGRAFGLLLDDGKKFLVREDDVGRDAFFPGGLRSPFADGVEKGPVTLSEIGGWVGCLPRPVGSGRTLVSGGRCLADYLVLVGDDTGSDFALPPSLCELRRTSRATTDFAW